MKKFKLITMPMAIVLASGAACFAAIALWAPPEVHEGLFGINGLVWTIAAAYLKSQLAKEE